MSSKVYLKFIQTMIEKIDKEIEKVRPRLEEEIKDPIKLRKTIEFHRTAIMLQAVIRGTISYMKKLNISVSAASSLIAEDLEDVDETRGPELIGSFALVYPESLEELDFHVSSLWSYLEALEAGIKNDVYTKKSLKKALDKIEQRAEENAKEYEKFVVRGKL